MLNLKWGMPLVQLCTIVYFLLGYYGTKQDYLDINTQASTNLEPMKVILIVIDALRIDLFTNENFTFYRDMKFKHNESQILFKSIATSPTATMLNIKSMMVGNYPSFISFGLNTNAQASQEDSVIDQAKRNNKKIAQLGDETWLKLFPDQFDLKHAMDPFDVHDIDSNDNIVTRYLNDLIIQNQYDLIVAHLCGLDHTGHLFNDSNSQLWNKQKQYSKILEQAYNAMDNQTILIVVSDHGMTKSGNHGGNTESETSSTFYAIKKQGKFDIFTNPLTDTYNRIINQVDTAPTISYLLGISLPFSSIGAIIPEIINFNDNGCQENMQQIWNLVSKQQIDQQRFSQNIFEQWKIKINQRKQCREIYEIINEIQEESRKLFAEYDYEYMIIGVGLIITLLSMQMMLILEESSNISIVDKCFFIINRYEFIVAIPFLLIFSLQWRIIVIKFLAIYFIIIILKKVLQPNIKNEQFRKMKNYFSIIHVIRKRMNTRCFFFVFNLIVQNGQYLLSFNRQIKPSINIFGVFWSSIIILCIIQSKTLTSFKQIIILLILMLYAEQYNENHPDITEPHSIFQLDIFTILKQNLFIKYIFPIVAINTLFYKFNFNKQLKYQIGYQTLLILAELYIISTQYFQTESELFLAYIPQFVYFTTFLFTIYFKDIKLIFPLVLLLSGSSGLQSYSSYLLSIVLVSNITKFVSHSWKPVIIGGLIQSLTFFYWFAMGNRLLFSSIDLTKAFIGFTNYNQWLSPIILLFSVMGIFTLEKLIFTLMEWNQAGKNQNYECAYEMFIYIQIFFQYLHNMLNLFNVLILTFAQKLIFDVFIAGTVVLFKLISQMLNN